jgi:quercetin dioxygenase-like cupin family protein
LAGMSCHASVLAGGGHSPHPPHAHGEEELLIPLTGEVELLIADSATDPTPLVERLGPHGFVYYPAGQHHTIRNPSAGAVGYLMFKWHASSSSGPNSGPLLATRICRYGDMVDSTPSASFHTQRVVEGPTAHLRKLHSHVTTLQPGGGYAPHVDGYDVAIVTLSGTLETLGQRVEPGSVIYYAAGESHGMRNVGTDAARYLVFEFHSPGVDAFRDRASGYGALPDRVLRVGRRLAGRVWRRLRSR